MIHYDCEECGAARKVSDDMAGRKVRCQACKELGTVPEPDSAEAPSKWPLIVPRIAWGLFFAWAFVLTNIWVVLTLANPASAREGAPLILAHILLPFVLCFAFAAVWRKG